jgi:3-phenylpropionate/trans-cinnamate dioxygenase ferredoxin reductase subunit
MAQQFVIVGAGQAATQAAATLRQSGHTGGITIIGEEPELPYQRPPLSKKYLAGELERERLHLRPATFYEQHDITLELGQHVAALQLPAQRVLLADGRHISYDGLMLATGSRVRKLTTPGADLRGVYYLRTLADADAIATALARSERRLLIVGAGYIGLEVAAVAVQRGLDVTVLEAAACVMSRVVGPPVAAFYEAQHRAAGVKIHTGVSVERICGDDCVEAVLGSDGQRFECDLVIVGIGIEPRTELAQQAAIDCDAGIVVDQFARTSAPAVVAAGDCTNHPSALYARRVRLESVHNAIEQAKSAAASLLGQERPYGDVPWFWSDQYSIKLQIAGLSQGYDGMVVRGEPATRSFAVFYLRSGIVIAAEAINSPRDFIAAKKLIAARAAVPGAVLADPVADLSQIAAAPA